MPDAGTVLLPSTVEVKVDGALLASTVSHKLVSVRVELVVGAANWCELRLDDGDFTILDADTFKIGKVIEISFADVKGAVTPKVFVGPITAIGMEQTFSDRHDIVVEAHDKSMKMYTTTKVRTFANSTYSDIVTKIAQENGLSSDVVSLSQNFPYILQSGTDAAMLDEITLRTGTEWLVDDEKLILRKPSSASPVATVKLGEDLVKFKARFSAAGHIDEVKVLGWDPKQKQPITSVDANTATNPTGASSPGQVGTMRSSTTSLKGKMQTSALAVESQSEGNLIAASLAARQAGDELLVRGQLFGMPTLTAGSWIKVSNVGTRLSGNYYLTQVEHTFGRNGDLITKFTAGGTKPAAIVDLVGGGTGSVGSWSARGLVVGLVTNVKDPDHMGRVKVKFPSLSESDESTWARLASPNAGNGRGFQFFPDVNDEVIVGFENGDYRRPFVLGSMWNGVDKPVNVSDDQVLASDGKVIEWQIKTKAGHVLKFNDKDGEESISLVHKEATTKLFLSKNKVELHNAGSNKPVEIKSGQATVLLSDDEIKLTAKKITIEAQTDVVIKGTNVTATGQSAVKIGGTQVEVKADATGKFEAGGPLTLKGAIVKIN